MSEEDQVQSQQAAATDSGQQTGERAADTSTKQQATPEQFPERFEDMSERDRQLFALGARAGSDYTKKEIEEAKRQAKEQARHQDDEDPVEVQLAAVLRDAKSKVGKRKFQNAQELDDFLQDEVVTTKTLLPVLKHLLVTGSAVADSVAEEKVLKGTQGLAKSLMEQHAAEFFAANPRLEQHKDVIRELVEEKGVPISTVLKLFPKTKTEDDEDYDAPYRSRANASHLETPRNYRGGATPVQNPSEKVIQKAVDAAAKGDISERDKAIWRHIRQVYRQPGR